MTDYYSNPAISASGLKLIARSPAHFIAEKPDPSDAMLLGTITHAAFLEPGEFDNRYAVIPEGISLATKEGKAIRDGILSTGKQPIKHADMERIFAMQKSVFANPEYQRLMQLPHESEREHYFNIDGTPAKMKPDLFFPPCEAIPRGLLVDLKTTSDASPEQFQRQVFRLDMPIQAAFYVDAIERQGYKLPDFMWLAIETRAPYLCKFYVASAATIEYGRARYTELLETYRQCMQSGVWPGYGDDIASIDPPEWLAGGEVEISFVNDEGTT